MDTIREMKLNHILKKVLKDTGKVFKIFLESVEKVEWGLFVNYVIK